MLRPGEKRYLKGSLGTADDALRSDAEPKGQVLSWRDAQQEALAWFAREERRLAGEEPDEPGPYTVAQATADYLAYLEAHRASAPQAGYAAEAHILPTLGELQVARLTAERLRAWHEGLARSPARVRTKLGAEKRTRAPKSAEERRQRKATANRVLATLKAALNRAYDDGKVPSPDAWRRVKPFRGVEEPRAGYLEAEQVERLLNSCAPDFRDLVEAALHTGARYGELAALRVGDYKAEAAAVHFPKTKSGRRRDAFLSDEGVAFFDRLTAGREAGEPLLPKADGSTWGRNHQQRPMREACEAATIDPPVGFHQLRHTYASHTLMNGGSLVALAKQLGHTTTRMVEKHYGHLSDTWRAEEARAHAPRLGRSSGKVTRLRKRA
jgi:integrase